jgi:hypothetical protein
MATTSFAARTPTLLRIALVSCGATLLAACPPSGPKSIPIVPMCTVLCDVGTQDTTAKNGRVFVAERTDPIAGSNFKAFRSLGIPFGNPGITANTTGIPDVFAINESWLRGGAIVFRGQATPELRHDTAGDDFHGSSWRILSEDSFGKWMLLGTGTANKGDESDDVVSAAATVPRFMPVGLANLEMFACVGDRTDDNAERTTSLISVTPPNPATGVTGGTKFVQDLLNGDGRFVPNKPIPSAPLSPAGFGPPTPPMPTVSGPGNLNGLESVMCVMSQLNDDVNSRQLHMLAISGGNLYHSVASDFGPVTASSSPPSTFNRFRSVSPWGDVGAALGGRFRTIRSAAIVGHPTSVSVFFLADAGTGFYKLWHAVRFAAGSWRPPDDVLALNGDAPTGTVLEFNVSAGNCPAFGAADWNDTTNETLVALSGGSSNRLGIRVIRVLSAPQSWPNGVISIYSPMQLIPPGPLTLASSFYLQNVSVAARPFADNVSP